MSHEEGIYLKRILHKMEPLHKTVYYMYKTVLDIRWFKGGLQKHFIQIKMYRLDRKMTIMLIFLNNLYIFIWIVSKQKCIDYIKKMVIFLYIV